MMKSFAPVSRGFSEFPVRELYHRQLSAVSYQLSAKTKASTAFLSAES
jgi:hypothetical protein